MSHLVQRALSTRFACLLALCAVSCSEETEAVEAPAMHAPRQRSTARPELPPSSARRGERATYTIARGGTLRNVANLYKIHHHEIVRLNPHIDPDQPLEPTAQVTVYAYDDDRSESIGLPHDGRIVGAMPMLDGPGRRITAERWKTWASRSTILQLDEVLREWDRTFPDAPPVLIGNLSAREGGPLAPHKTHQSGRDVDLSYIAKWDGTSAVSWQHMGRHNLDARRTWQLLKLLVRKADIEVIFIDRSIQRLLLEHAKRHGTLSQRELRRWLEVARGAKREEALIRHVPGHRDHIHVRFSCGPRERQCRS